MSRPRLVVLGAGPAGLGAAWRAATRGLADVTVVERAPAVGGNAGSFELEGLRVDYGSHRLHPACPSEILADLRSLLGDDLLDRPRHGRIRLQGRWIHFPLRPLDLALRLPPRFALGAAADAARRAVVRPAQTHIDASFATVLRAGLGRTMAEAFYFPFARKIWGVEPSDLEAEQARRRVSAGSPGRLVAKALSSLPGLRRPGAGRFYYPRRGFGQIAEAYLEAARRQGVAVLLGAEVRRVEGGPEGCEVVAVGRDGEIRIVADRVWSTIPVTALARALAVQAPSSALAAADQLRFRAMVLVYLVLERDRFSSFDAHYFPEPEVAMSRLSEPKNYAAGEGPQDLTALCAELPCQVGDEVWTADDDDLARRVVDGMTATGLELGAPLRRVAVRRLPHAYPVYRRGSLAGFSHLDEWLERMPWLLSFGRQGLFAHDNTHHTLAMAYAAVDCLAPDGGFNHERWRCHRREFLSHVVED